MTLTVSMVKNFVQRAPSAWNTISANVSSSVEYDFRLADAVGNLLTTPLLNTWYQAGTGQSVVSIPVPHGVWRIAVRERANPSNIVLSSTATLVGDGTVFLGHSIMTNMLGTYTDVAAPTSSGRTTMVANGVYRTPEGQGMISVLNAMEAGSGVPQAASNTTFGNTTLTISGYLSWLVLGGSAPVGGCYLMNDDNVGSNPFGKFLTDKAALGGFCRVILDIDWHDQHIEAREYANGIFELWRLIQAQEAVYKVPQLKLGLVRPYSPILDFSEIRKGHDMAREMLPEAFEIDRSGITYPDDYHPEGAGYLEHGAAIADAVLAKEGFV